MRADDDARDPDDGVRDPDEGVRDLGTGRLEGAVDPDVDLHDPQQAAGKTSDEVAVLIAIALGGVIGAEARYGVGRSMPHSSDQLPWATLLINSTGCLLLGVLMVVVERRKPHRLVRPFLGVGILGGYTTFSSFAVDVQDLVRADRLPTGLAYGAATLLIGWVAVWIGIAGTRRFEPPARKSSR